LFPFLLLFASKWCFEPGKRWLRVVGGFIATFACWWFLGFSQIGGLQHEVNPGYREIFSTEQPELQKKVISLKRFERLEDGSYKARGRKPSIDFSVKSTPGKPNQVFFLEMEVVQGTGDKGNESRGQGELFWATSEAESFPMNHRKDFLFRSDGVRRVYRVSPSMSPQWKGEIGKFRVRFDGLQPGGVVTIHDIRLAR
jgi:hypothetical protein